MHFLLQENKTLLLDAFSGAALGYSVRKLSVNYGGSCLRVRESGGNTEQDIGFVNNELDTASMKTFVGANSGYVVTWYDQSGNANHATQATAANQPRIINAGVVERQSGKVTIYFDGINDVLGYTGFSAYTDWSQFVVQRRNTTGARSISLSSSLGGVLMSQWTDGNFYIQRVTSGTDKYDGGVDATATYVLISGFTLSAGGMSAYKNFTTYGTTGEINFTTAANQFDNLGSYGASPMNSWVSEVILYTSDKSASRTQIQSNINRFYRLW